MQPISHHGAELAVMRGLVRSQPSSASPPQSGPNQLIPLRCSSGTEWQKILTQARGLVRAGTGNDIETMARQILWRGPHGPPWLFSFLHHNSHELFVVRPADRNGGRSMSPEGQRAPAVA